MEFWKIFKSEMCNLEWFTHTSLIKIEYLQHLPWGKVYSMSKSRKIDQKPTHLN